MPSPFFEEERIGNLDIPYSTPGSSDQRVWCLSNPAMFKINETIVGVTTNDILFHLSGEEVRAPHTPIPPLSFATRGAIA